MTSTARLVIPTALALAATLALSACGAQQSGAAAIVNGTVISDQEAQSVSDQINTISEEGQELSVSNALISLILAPYVSDEAKRVGKTVASSQARAFIAKVPDPTSATLEFVQMQLALGQLDDASKTSIVTAIGKAKITVNPRYGAFDAQQVVLTPISPNWIKPPAASPPK